MYQMSFKFDNSKTFCGQTYGWKNDTGINKSTQSRNQPNKKTTLKIMYNSL